jgi:hypothetical protein
MLMCSLKYNDPYIVLGLNDISTKPKPAPVVQPATLDGAPTGIWGEFLRVARGEIGYYEKSKNADLDDPTANRGNGNYTKYGKDISANGGPWCASFVSWVAKEVGLSDEIPRFATTGEMIMPYVDRGDFKLSISAQKDALAAYNNQQAKDNGREGTEKGSDYTYGGRTYDTSREDFSYLFQSTSRNVIDSLLAQGNQPAYQPEAGDLILFRSTSAPGPRNHIGIVEASSGNTVYTIEGNVSTDISIHNAIGVHKDDGIVVKDKNYQMGIDRILGYCRNYTGTTGIVPGTSTPGTGTGL